jgi:Phosphotransferase enzyme family
LVEAGQRPELTVAPVELSARAIATEADAILLEGRGGTRPLARAGYTVHRYLALPGIEEPDLVLPVGRGTPASYALCRWRPAAEPSKRIRNRTLALLLEHGAFPDVGPVQQRIGLRNDGPPFLVRAASALGVPVNAGWFMTRGQGDPLGRAVLHLFEPGADDPAWVLKFARVKGYAVPFDRDEQGLRLAHSAAVASEHAPRLVGRFEAGGVHVSVETAAVGERLSTLLGRDGTAREARVATDEVAAWIIRLGRETAEPPAALAAERARLAGEVLPRWLEAGAPPDLVERLPDLPAVLQHNDLGSWNIVVRPGGFTALDWESARPSGLPLWDLLYFLVDVLPQLDGARSADERAELAILLLRGQARSSPVLFDWVRKAVQETSLPSEAVGPVATLCWLHHGLSHVARSARAEGVEEGSSADLPPVERIASAWLTDPRLGPEWSLWREQA